MYLNEGQNWIGNAETARATAEAAARLSRADLATSLVTELTGLAGTMGRHYALQCGVQPEVAEASCYKAAHVQHPYTAQIAGIHVPTYQMSATGFHA